MTRKEIAAIDWECVEQHSSQQEYLAKHAIAKHQYYRWKRRYREEDEQSLATAGFVPEMPGTYSTNHAQKFQGQARLRAKWPFGAALHQVL